MLRHVQHLTDETLTAVTRGQLSENDIAARWMLIKRCLVQVFGIDAQTAEGLVDQFVADIDANFSDRDILIVYHASPLQIAADLAGASDRALSADEEQRYAAFINEVAAGR